MSSIKSSIQAPPGLAGSGGRGPLSRVPARSLFSVRFAGAHTGDHDRVKPRVRGVLQSFKGSLSIITERVVARRKHQYRWDHRMERRAGW